MRINDNFRIFSPILVPFYNFVFIVDTITNVLISLHKLFAPLHPAPAPLSLWPSPHCWLCLRVVHRCSLVNSFTFFHPVPPPILLCQLSVCSMWPRSDYILFITSFCSLYSTYKWAHMVFIFLWLAYLISIIISRFIHAVAKGKSSFSMAT